MTTLENPIKAKEEKQDFFSKNLFVILSFLLPATIMFAVFCVQDFFPFGNRMIMVIDSWHQYYPFLAEYQRMLKDGASMLYSFNVGGGANFLGIIANYLACPLYLLSYFVPSGTPWLQAFLALTVVFRFGLAGFSFALMLRKVFGKNDPSILAFGMLYAFCAFAIGYYWNVMWLDTFAIMPLVIAGVVGVLRDRKFSLYIISLALSVIFSFYIGYMVCLFVLIFAVGYTLASFVSMKHSLKNALKMLLFTGIAFMLTGFITVPTYMALSASDSAGMLSSFPTEYTINYAYGYDEHTFVNTLKAILRTATNLLAYTRPIKVDQGLPNIACGVLAVVLLPFYFVTKKIKLREKIISLTILIFFILSFVINQLNYIWHGMNTPAMVYYRWSFIFSFALLFLAYRAFVLLDGFGKKTFIASAVLILLYLGASLFMQRKLSVAITAAGAFVILLGFVLYRKKKLRKQMLCILLCAFVFCEVSLTAYYGVMFVGHSENDNYPQNYSEVTELLDIAENSSEGELVRTEFLRPYTLNDGALYGEFGLSTFNSMCDKSYPDFLAELGIAASKSNNRYVYWETTPVADMLLGIKYNIARDGGEALDTGHKTLVATTDECALYENTSYLPMGFVASKDILGYELKEAAQMPVQVQNEIFSRLTGIDKDVFTVVKPSGELYGEHESLVKEKDAFDYYYEVDLKENPTNSTEDELSPLYIEYTLEEDGSYYSMLYNSAGEVNPIYVNGDEENPIEINQEYSYLAATGYFKKGDRLKVEIPLINNKYNSITTYLIKLDEEVFREGYEKLSRSVMSLEEFSGRYIRGSINAKEDGLFTTAVLYDEGFSAYVDGKEVEITPIGESLIAFPITEGEHEIELRYTPQGLYTGITVSIIGLAAFVLTGLVYTNYRRKHPAVSQNTSGEAQENIHEIPATGDNREEAASEDKTIE
ncbi:MAG: YfhO family protein [Eubacteriales bacterium]|nr:YfhO family protein [Eubacteriales bacterium]